MYFFHRIGASTLPCRMHFEYRNSVLQPSKMECRRPTAPPRCSREPCTPQELRHHSLSYHTKCRLDVKIAQGQCALTARAWHRRLFSCFLAIPCDFPRKMCDHELQVLSVQHILGAHRAIVALHRVVLFLQEWYHRCRTPRRKTRTSEQQPCTV